MMGWWFGTDSEENLGAQSRCFMCGGVIPNPEKPQTLDANYLCECEEPHSVTPQDHADLLQYYPEDFMGDAE